MRSSDRILIAIVAAVLVLVVVAFAVVLRQPEATYAPDATPEGVAYNYLLALQRRDFPKAHGYLASSLPGRPESADDMEDDRMPGGAAWMAEVEQGTSFTTTPESVRDKRATVLVTARYFHSGGLFEDTEGTNRFRMKLQRDNGDWRLTSSEMYWNPCWDTPSSWECRNRGAIEVYPPPAMGEAEAYPPSPGR